MKTNKIADAIESNLDRRPLHSSRGRVNKVVGPVIHGHVPGVKVGDLCQLQDPKSNFDCLAEVIGFNEDLTILTPFSDIQGLSPETEINPTGRQHEVFIHAGLKGQVLDGMGKALSKDDAESGQIIGEHRPVMSLPPDPLKRKKIDKPFVTGVKIIDSLLTVGRGQRIGLLAAPGVGKSTLLGSISQSADADTIVVALIGERGREVNEFIEKIPEDIRKKTVLVIATSDRSPMERVKAAYVATAVAEYFRDQGENVLFLLDSITRFARSLRDVGLSAGETPTRRGYPPSIYQALPKLVERTGNNDLGTITAFYTVLVEGNDMSDPIADEVSSLLDGQFILSRELQQKGQYPAIDPLKSLSRCMTAVTSEQHQEHAQQIKDLLGKYESVKLLVDIGEYKQGQDAHTDRAIALNHPINEFLKQKPDNYSPFEDTVRQIEELVLR